MQNFYNDIISLSPPEPGNHIKMNLNQRAKIFLPFAALTGYEQSLERRLSEVEEKYEHKPPVHEIDDDFGF